MDHLEQYLFYLANISFFFFLPFDLRVTTHCSVSVGNSKPSNSESESPKAGSYCEALWLNMMLPM